MELENIFHDLKSATTADEVLEQHLLELSKNISLMEGRGENEISFLNPDWLRRNDDIAKAFRAFILNFVTAFPTLVRPVIKMIIRSFIPVKDSSLQGKHFKVDTPNVSERFHRLLHSIVQLVPSSSAFLIQMLANNYPYLKLNIEIQLTYVRNLLQVTKYLPNFRKLILEIVISKMIQFDTYCPKDVIEEAEQAEDETLFTMETDTLGKDSKLEDEMKHEEARVLDELLQIMYLYIDGVCRPTDGAKLDWEATKKLYKDLLTIFDAVILPTHACSHAQFIMFYICSFQKALCEGFIDYLWKKVQSPNISPVIRQASVCYIGSLLCRATFIHIGMAKDSLQLMSNWLHTYLDNHVGGNRPANYGYHGTFYAVCQTLFYVIAFRHKELVELKNGLLFLRGLNIDRLVTCTLNPLKVCLPAVVTNFASIARNYQVAYCYTIIERNNRLSIPVASEAATLLDGMSSFVTLDTFFPFDPYILKRSGQKISALYRIFSGPVDPDPIENVEEDEDDFIQDGVSNMTPTVEAFSYGTSPGFKELLSPKSCQKQ